MIHWGWVVSLCFLFANFGFFAAALLAASHDQEDLNYYTSCSPFDRFILSGNRASRRRIWRGTWKLVNSNRRTK